MKASAGGSGEGMNVTAMRSAKTSSAARYTTPSTGTDGSTSSTATIAAMNEGTRTASRRVKCSSRRRSSAHAVMASAHGTIVQPRCWREVVSQSANSGATIAAFRAHVAPFASSRATGRRTSGSSTGSSIRPAIQRNGPCAS
jgi:hypothetical protein